MDSMHLKLNMDKTEFIIFGSKHQLRKLDKSPLDANGDLIHKSKVVRYLGGHLDASLTFETHIKSKVRTVMANFIKIRSTWHYLSIGTCTTLVQTICISHIDYANALLFGSTAKVINKLQSLQNVCEINIKKIQILKFKGMSLQIALATCMTKDRLHDLNNHS